ncbi:MAG TPA: transketolase [Gammaproteobacteria bacterium]|nr:transketolase [Gammaproteobacteria bacterium]
MDDTDRLCINTLRFLAVDQVERAGSGHPGLPLDAAPMAYVLWDRFLRHDPSDPDWFDRDRFILSAGHGSALLYSLLHLYGYDLPLSELERFRQWGSKTPGHPEHGDIPGVEATTGPLGQGFAMGVGMAIAEARLAARYNRADHGIVDHYTYAIVSDGDLMEGVASEAASLAGHLRLGKLVYLYDANHISIAGDTGLAFTEDVGARFEAYGWHVQHVADGNDIETIDAALRRAREEDTAPSLIVVRTHIGYGSPKQDTAAAHGAALGEDAWRATREKLGWPLDEWFRVPDEAAAHARERAGLGRALHESWNAALQRYRDAYPEAAAELERVMRGALPEGWTEALPVFTPDDGPVATRNAGGEVLNALADRMPELLGGAADLAPSTKTLIEDGGDFAAGDRAGRNLRFGVREHAMMAALNGMALHGGVVPYGSTFLIFSDYARPAIRLGALMGVKAVYVFTHDSIGLGEDGPTHQPVSQLLALRGIPRLVTLRPADANETVAAWRVALEGDGPVALALSRQKLPVLDADPQTVVDGVARGAYVLVEAGGGDPALVLVASGSEVALVRDAAERLAGRGVATRVVSMPSWELFDAQDAGYRERVLPRAVPALAVEAGSPRGWRDYVGDRGAVLGLTRFGASAPGEEVMARLGFTVDNVVGQALALLGRD